MVKSNYFQLESFKESGKERWDDFCQKSSDAWLWHSYNSIISKSFWNNFKNISFCVMDRSNRSKIVAIVPLFIIKRRKIIDYSTLESLGGPAIIDDITNKKKKKLISYINFSLQEKLEKYKVNKIEFIYSSLSPKIIKQNRPIPNPLLPYINKDLSSLSWMVKLKNKKESEIFDSFDSSAKQTINKASKKLKFNELKKEDSRKLFNIYYGIHLKTSERKNIKPHNKDYFKYIFEEFPEENRKIFYVTYRNEILTFSIFGVYKKNIIYWTNTSSSEGLKIGSNYFCMWKSIEYFTRNNFENFECGEGFLNTENKNEIGLNIFKKSFGGTDFPLYKGERIKNKFIDIFHQSLFNLKRSLFKENV